MGCKHLTTIHHLIKYSVSRSHTVVSSLEPKLYEGNMSIKNNSHPRFTQIILCFELCLPTTKYNLQQCLKTQHNRATINSFTYSHCTFSLEYKYNLNQRLKIPPMYIVQICWSYSKSYSILYQNSITYENLMVNFGK